MPVITLSLAGHPWQTFGDFVIIDGVKEQFAVHSTCPRNLKDGDPNFSVSHVNTGFRVASGQTPEDAVSEAKRVWSSKTNEQIEIALEAATKFNQEVAMENAEAEEE